METFKIQALMRNLLGSSCQEQPTAGAASTSEGVQRRLMLFWGRPEFPSVRIPSARPFKFQIIGRDHLVDGAPSWPGALHCQPEVAGVGARICLILGVCPKSLFSAFALMVTSRKEVTLCRRNDVQIIAGLREILVIMKSVLYGYQLAWSCS